jgi:twitching motility protein PilT
MPKIDEYLLEMIDKGGSDLHLCSTLPPKIRVHGVLEALPAAPISQDDMFNLLQEICPENKWEWYLSNLDQDLAYEIPGVARFRVNSAGNLRVHPRPGSGHRPDRQRQVNDAGCHDRLYQ